MEILDFLTLKLLPSTRSIPYNFTIYTIYSDFIGRCVVPA